ncbi:hypothetical protein IT072_03695 [Leifsonia sp. ZF2019]|uniref:hypothetical protein n=1 Tax=Leifsonia sp. ZF2019 TaxID=2781978 RepID=UPI001CBDA762|nr:hypothetical protein [Leifsonia sp. ZF2019]UAJ80162.1 hypothetical protein IT072_03695 [Leifsonia sp. ZF2019]
MSLAFFLLFVAVLWPVLTCLGRGRRDGVSWFVVLPHLTESKKRHTRLQQTRKHGARRY